MCLRGRSAHLSAISHLSHVFVVLSFAEKQLKYRGRTQSMSNKFTDNYENLQKPET
jgi:hypothetical protein